MSPKIVLCGTVNPTSPTARRPPKFFVTPLRTRSAMARSGLHRSRRRGLRRLRFGRRLAAWRSLLLEQLALAEDALGAHDHHDDEDHRVDDHAERVEIERLERLLQVLDRARALHELDGLDGERDEQAADRRAAHAAR